MKIGVFTDNHCGGHEEKILEGFAKDNVDIIVSLGDIIEPGKDKELESITDKFLSLKKPFISIPGNYENLDAWNSMSNNFRYNFNFIDGLKNIVFNYNSVSFISIPWLNTSNYAYIKETALKQADLRKSIILSHEPPKQNGEHATDLAVQAENLLTKQIVFGRNTKAYIDSGKYRKRFENQGDIHIKEIIDDLDLNFVLSGHIHEGLGAYSKRGQEIKENTYSSSMFFNPGPAKNGIYAIVTIDEKNMMLMYKRYFLLGLSYYEDLKK